MRHTDARRHGNRDSGSWNRGYEREDETAELNNHGSLERKDCEMLASDKVKVGMYASLIKKTHIYMCVCVCVCV